MPIGTGVVEHTAKFLDRSFDDTKSTFHLSKPPNKRLNPVARDKVRRNSRKQRLDSLEPPARQAQVRSDFAVQPRKEERATNIREETNGGLGHGKQGAFCGDTNRCVDRDADTAAHRNAVHDCDNRGIHGREHVIQLVFFVEKLERVIEVSGLGVQDDRWVTGQPRLNTNGQCSITYS